MKASFKCCAECGSAEMTSESACPGCGARYAHCSVEFCRNNCPAAPDDIEVFRASGMAICEDCGGRFYDHKQFHSGSGHVVQGCDGRFYHL